MIVGEIIRKWFELKLPLGWPRWSPCRGIVWYTRVCEISTCRHEVRNSFKFSQISPTTRTLRHIDFEDPGKHLDPRVVGHFGSFSILGRCLIAKLESGCIGIERKAVDGETPFALGESDFFVIAKVLAKTSDILPRMWSKGNLAGNGKGSGVIKNAVLLKEGTQCGILHDFTVVTQISEAYTEVFDVIRTLLDKLEDIVIILTMNSVYDVAMNYCKELLIGHRNHQWCPCGLCHPLRCISAVLGPQRQLQVR